MADQFGWIGSGRQETVLAAIRVVASTWLQGWRGAGNTDLDVAPWSWSESSTQRDATWFAGDRWLAIGLKGGLARFGASLAGVAEEGDPIALHLGTDAARSFFDALVVKAGKAVRGTALEVIDVVPPSLSDARLGAMAVSVTWGDVGLELLVGRDLIDGLAPPGAAAEPVALAERQSLIETLRQKVEVTLDLGELTLRDAKNLRPGDVLATDITLDVLARLSAGGVTLEGLAARAGRHGSHRAIALEIINTPEH